MSGEDVIVEQPEPNRRPIYAYYGLWSPAREGAHLYNAALRRPRKPLLARQILPDAPTGDERDGEQGDGRDDDRRAGRRVPDDGCADPADHSYDACNHC